MACWLARLVGRFHQICLTNIVCGFTAHSLHGYNADVYMIQYLFVCLLFNSIRCECISEIFEMLRLIKFDSWHIFINTPANTTNKVTKSSSKWRFVAINHKHKHIVDHNVGVCVYIPRASSDLFGISWINIFALSSHLHSFTVEHVSSARQLQIHVNVRKWHRIEYVRCLSIFCCCFAVTQIFMQIFRRHHFWLYSCVCTPFDTLFIHVIHIFTISW